MKKCSLFLILSIITVFVLTGCNNSSTTNNKDNNTTSSSIQTSSKIETVSFTDEVNKINDEYTEKIKKDELFSLTKSILEDTTLQENFKTNSSDALKAVREKYEYVAKFITKGSLVGPKAPETIEKAIEYIKNEYKDKLETTKLEELLSIYAKETTDYKNNPQGTFDAFRESTEQTIKQQ